VNLDRLEEMMRKIKFRCRSRPNEFFWNLRPLRKFARALDVTWKRKYYKNVLVQSRIQLFWKYFATIDDSADEGSASLKIEGVLAALAAIAVFGIIRSRGRGNRLSRLVGSSRSR